MGIPSFYRHLLRKYPKLIGRGAGPAPEWLCLDFNCAMYTVLRTMPPLPAGGAAAWEADLCKGIAAYMDQLITLGRPTRGVYVSCDGVVCAAKRRQQRLRRFKGPWMSAAEAEVKRSFSVPVAGSNGADAPTDAVAHAQAQVATAKATAPVDAQAQVTGAWDQNALTPGSAFMAALGNTLTAAGKRISTRIGVTVIVSTTSEPGEGEHKLLAYMRAVRPKTCTIYGLDADLILLSMLLSADTGADVRLLREAQEFEATAVDGIPEWRNLTITGLRDVMLKTQDERRVRDFVATMSLLGNDFLPRSLTHTVRDNGIPNLIATLEQDVWGHGLHVVGADGAVTRDGLLPLVEAWAATEGKDMIDACWNAVRSAERPVMGNGDQAEKALKEWQSQPARWCSIAQLLAPATKPRWRDHYRRVWQAGRAGDYLAGVAWVWDYYSGRTFDWGWCFEPHLPPLWCDIADALRTAPATLAAPPVTWPTPLPEWAHLLSVLPVASVERLLPAAQGSAFIKAEPWWWPSGWSLFDVGRGQMWECEPVIPLIPEEVVRGWARNTGL